MGNTISDALQALGVSGTSNYGAGMQQQWQQLQQWSAGTAAATTHYTFGDVYTTTQPTAPTPAKRSKKKPASGSALEWLDERVNEMRVAL